MKKAILSLVVALLATVGVQAQQISVVYPSGSTTLYRTLSDAIEGAEAGSVIYLPGGSFPISDDVKITKKLTIIGIGHYVKNGNVDGATTISGNLWFNEGSSGSAVMACYITGNVNIGDGGASVNDVLIRYCNLNSVQVKKNTCLATVLNQNYIRSTCSFSNSAVTITNNVLYKLNDINGGIISCNVLTCSNTNYYSDSRTLNNVNNVGITFNIFRKGNGYYHSGSNVQVNNNLIEGGSWGDSPVLIDAGINDILVNVNNWSISPSSNFHFKEDYKEYETKAGIYAGDGFNDNNMAPVPYIVAKRVDEQTDASGMLKVKIRVKAGE